MLRRAGLKAAALAVLLACAAPAAAQSIAEICKGVAPCIATGDLLSPLAGLPDSAAGRAALAANLQAEIAIYRGADAARKRRAALDSQLDNPPPFGRNAILYNLWDLAVPALAGRFDAYALAQPGRHRGPAAYRDLNLLVQANGGFAGALKNHFAGLDIYGRAYGRLQPGQDSGNPRPFLVTAQIAGHPWTRAGTSPLAVAIQQSADPPAPFQRQDWAHYRHSPSFPSGHSTAGNTLAILTALLLPQYHKPLVRAGLEFGRSRNVFGVHYPLDVIAGRLIATYNIAGMLADPAAYPDPSVTTGMFAAVGDALATDLGSGMASPYAAPCAADLAACLSRGAIPDAAAFAAERAEARALLGYGLPAIGPADRPAVVPEAAQLLIAGRFPYLSAAQRKAVLQTTALPSGGPLDDGSGWARLDLFAAADGYARFDSDVSVTMAAGRGGHHAFDVWAHPIGGSGGLTKAGSGTLVLAGDSSYGGGTRVAGGTLAVSGAIRGPVEVAAGATLVNAGTIDGDVTCLGRLVNTGTITGTVTLTADDALENSGRIAAPVRIVPAAGTAPAGAPTR